MRRSCWAAAYVIASVLLVVVSGCGSTKTVTRTVTAPAAGPPPGERVNEHVAAGAHDFVQFACAKCHGDRGRGGVSPAVPALTDAGRQLTVAQLKTIIDKGLGESKNPSQPYM